MKNWLVKIKVQKQRELANRKKLDSFLPFLSVRALPLIFQIELRTMQSSESSCDATLDRSSAANQ
jgi:hypothetical protein